MILHTRKFSSHSPVRNPFIIEHALLCVYNVMSKLSLSSSSLLLLHNQYPNISSSIAVVRPREREIAYFNRVRHLRTTWEGEKGVEERKRKWLYRRNSY
jgi:hypothetical protein